LELLLKDPLYDKRNTITVKLTNDFLKFDNRAIAFLTDDP